MMLVVRNPFALRERIEQARAAGERIGFVPTMGALHEGHLALVDRAKSEGATFRVVSIFVNPTQFLPGEDLDQYPRTFEADSELCEARGVDLIFAPTAEAMYGESAQTRVQVSGVSGPLEGAHRPGHFDGVTTIVSKFFNIVGPCTAIFGQKDYQQLKVIEQMTRDLHFPIRIVGHEIVREEDGLALSSRNRYLNKVDRKRALSLSRALASAKAAWDKGERRRESIESLMNAELRETDSVDYASLCDRSTLLPFENQCKAVALIAAYVGGTRLIDNRELG